MRGIAAGDLEPARFRSWLVQDYLFLLDYVRLFALAAARGPDAGTLGRLVDLAHATFHAATGDFAEIVAALLPCMWGYSEIGRALQAAGPPACRLSGSPLASARSVPTWTTNWRSGTPDREGQSRPAAMIRLRNACVRG